MQPSDLLEMKVRELVEYVSLLPNGFQEMAYDGLTGPVYVVVAVGDSADLLRGILDAALSEDGDGG